MFWFITLMIILLPVSMQYRLLLFGVYTKGQVVGVEHVSTLGIVNIGPDKYSIIRFSTIDGTVVQFYGPENFEYPVGRELKVVYNPKNPKECSVFSIGAIYAGRKAIVPGILFLLWMAFYLAFRTQK